MDDTAQPGAGMKIGPEEQIWVGRPSQWVNVVPFLLCVLILPIPYAVWRWLEIRCTKYTLTSQRLRYTHGVLHRRHDDLELYRVKDVTVSEPLIQRLVGLGTVRLVTSDATTPEMTLPAIREPLTVMEAVREQVEALRRARGVREFDVV
jgi:uncharacterized membrane protein YdbT with pleckstrin-like domain